MRKARMIRLMHICVCVYIYIYLFIYLYTDNRLKKSIIGYFFKID